MANLQVGVIGLGLGRTHVVGFQASPEVGRIVVCDANGELAAAVRAEHTKVAAVYDNIETMLARERLDAVSVVTPDHLHRAHATVCLEAGCHVLLTKPLAPNLADGRAIVKGTKDPAMARSLYARYIGS